MANVKQKQASVADGLNRNWGWLLALGMFFEVLGVIGLGMTIYLTLVSMIFFGILLLVGGASQIVDGIKSKEWKGLLWHILIAILYVLCGAVFIYDPFLASTFLTMVLGCIFVIMGIARFVMSMTLKNAKGWGWLLLAGLSSFILGILILLQWPMSGLWIIGLFIAIELIIAGWSYIFIALAMRQK